MPCRLISFTYQTYNATSSMVPGRVEDGDAGIATNQHSYRVYFSMDYSPSSGEPLVPDSRPS
jgi:hypothetical protein